MALTYFCFVSLLVFSMMVVSSGKEYYGYTNEPKYNAPEDQPKQDLNGPKDSSGNPDISTPKHFPITRSPVPRHIPVHGAPPAPKKPVFGPKPRYRMPRPSPRPVHKRPEHNPTPVYKKPGNVVPPFKNPVYTPVTPVYGLPDRNTPVQSPPSDVNSPANPPPPSPPVSTAPANSPLPPQAYKPLM
ncbi:hypothetical protein RND81_04G147700 [Saponaria officinalis]|uniref:Uncharacterized protein n=1 Tax=Saponaria officinalis TaxID=3572 RepID=A0AAW1LEI0_SAPOF